MRWDQKKKMSLLIVSVVREIGGCRLGGREAGVCKSHLGARTGESVVVTRNMGPLALESEF